MKINLWFIKFNLSWKINEVTVEFFGRRYLMLVGALVHLDWLYSVITNV